MTSLNPYQACIPAEELRTSQENCHQVQNKAHRAFRRKLSTWRIGTWNVRSMVDTEGPIEIASQRADGQRGESKKVDQIVEEMKRYNVKVAALQETKWLGNEMYQVGGSVILTAGREITSPGAPLQRGEGVAILLLGPAIDAWKKTGRKWKAWNSRLISACLQVGNTSSDRLHIISCYAPTRSASREAKEDFFNELENIISAIPSGEKYILLGDFNARVGSRHPTGDQWGGVRGPHGFGETNDAGKELLGFLSIQQATVCNTWFKKKEIHKQTWKHPKSKKWSCIDYVIMHQKERKMCLDVTVKRGAECNTDHNFVCAKIRIKKSVHRIRELANKAGRRFDVGKLTNNKDKNDEHEQSKKEEFQEKVLDDVKSAWPEEGTINEKWTTVRSALVKTAENLLGLAGRRQPDWFQESIDVLKPYIQLRNSKYAKWLATKKQEDLNSFKQTRREVRSVIRNAKNNWFKRKAEEVQKERFGGKKVWKSIRDMQRGQKGLLPSKTVVINDENGVPCSSPSEQQGRWRSHFSNVLNVESQFDTTEVGNVKQRRTIDDLSDKPSSAEVALALGKLKNGKASGSSNILPEMLKVGRNNENFTDMILDLVKAVWEERRVPQEWVDAILIPIPKKGNLSNCENWRGIALLEVMGKIVARIIQQRLQIIAERELPESQCGFRRGRGCTDMVFTVRQLTEKAFEHHTKQYIIFVDLKKAYDSVPREALWVVLKKLGAPDLIIDIIRSFHQNMKAHIRIDGELLEEIEVNNGLRQGCTMAPTLFNLYACAVVERWLSRVNDTDGVGTHILFKLDQQLHRRYTRNASREKLTECQFADDMALLASTRLGAEEAIRSFSSVTKAFGLTVSIPKTKLMVVGCGVLEEDVEPITIEGGKIESVTEFPYLGSLVADNGRIDVEVDKRIANASKAFGALRQAVFKNKDLSTGTKRLVYQACVLPVLLYGGECWTPLRKHLNQLNSFHQRCIRTALGITNKQQWEKRISSEEIREKWGDVDTVTTKLTKRRLEWLGHLARMQDQRIPKITLFSWLPQSRPPGGPRRRWRDLVKKDIKDAGIAENTWYKEALHREKWHQAYNESITEHQLSQRQQKQNGPREIQCNECGRCFRREGD